VGFDSTVKHMNLVDVAEGMATLYEAIEGKNEGYQERALTLALAHLEVSVYLTSLEICALIISSPILESRTEGLF